MHRLRTRLETDRFTFLVKKKWALHLFTKTGMLWATRGDCAACSLAKPVSRAATETP